MPEPNGGPLVVDAVRWLGGEEIYSGQINNETEKEIKQTAREQFVKVLPKDYSRVLRALAEAEAAGLSGDDAVMAAFEANRRDLARVGGN